jgi:NAD dependent epimerase/dehydratase
MKNKILITGAFGFIGSHLTEFFVKNNFNVIAFDRYNTNNDWGWLENSSFKNDIEVITGDIRDFDSVSKVVKDSNKVIHLAALIGIPYSYNSPLAYIKTNLEGTYNILESSKNCELDEVLLTSTSEVYGTALYTPIDELHPLQAQSPYSASKIAADNLGISYYKSYDLPIKIIRPFNNYGPRQSARAIIPTIISQLILKDLKKIDLGNLLPTRDFTYVEDTCDAIMKVLNEKQFFGEVINIGTNNEISIIDLATKISKLMKINLDINNDKKRIRPKNSEVERLVCSNKKLNKITNWEPNHTFDEGLKKTIEWFKENNNHLKPHIFNV